MNTFKPSRTTSKRLTWATFVLAWATLWLGMWQGDGMAAVVAPAMVGLIVLVVGAYMGVGHADLRVMVASAMARDASAGASTPAPEPAPEEPEKQKAPP